MKFLSSKKNMKFTNKKTIKYKNYLQDYLLTMIDNMNIFSVNSIWKSLIFLFCQTLSFNMFTQNSVAYQYDNNGNRTQRFFVGLSFKPGLPITQKDSSETLKDEMESVTKNGLSVYPNPTKDAVNVTIMNPNIVEHNTNSTLYLMDNNGKILEQQKNQGGETSFNLSNYSAGNYYVRVKFNRKESVYYKVVKVN